MKVESDGVSNKVGMDGAREVPGGVGSTEGDRERALVVVACVRACSSASEGGRKRGRAASEKRARAKLDKKAKESRKSFQAGAPRGAVRLDFRSSGISPSLMKATRAGRK